MNAWHEIARPKHVVADALAREPRFRRNPRIQRQMSADHTHETKSAARSAVVSGRDEPPSPASIHNPQGDGTRPNRAFTRSDGGPLRVGSSPCSRGCRSRHRPPSPVVR